MSLQQRGPKKKNIYIYMKNIPGFLVDVAVTPSSLTSYHFSTFLIASTELA